MAVPSIPDIAVLSTLSPPDITAALDALFEPTSTLHNLLLPTIRSTSFESYDALIDYANAELMRLSINPSPASREALHSILGSHPRLGAKKVESAQSSAEQAQLNSGSDGTELAKLNAEYEERFPGLRYVVFVNGRGRPEIMANMRERIDRGDIKQEEREAIQAMCDIAKDRARKLQASKA